MSDKVYDLKGTTINGKVRVVIRPGFGIRLPDPDQPGDKDATPPVPPGFRHYGYEDGTVEIPVVIASDMLHDGRAFLADENGYPVNATGEAVNTDAAADAVDAVNAASPAEAE